jgi:hypothetical protein
VVISRILIYSIFLNDDFQNFHLLELLDVLTFPDFSRASWARTDQTVLLAPWASWATRAHTHKKKVSAALVHIRMKVRCSWRNGHHGQPGHKFWKMLLFITPYSEVFHTVHVLRH